MIEKNTAIAENSLFSRSADIIVRRVQDETILLDLNSGIYYSLDDVGGYIWSLLDVARTPRQLADLVSAEYAVEPETAMADIAELLADLLGEGLISPA